jgi:hypothetical protein
MPFTINNLATLKRGASSPHQQAGMQSDQEETPVDPSREQLEYTVASHFQWAKGRLFLYSFDWHCRQNSFFLVQKQLLQNWRDLALGILRLATFP